MRLQNLAAVHCPIGGLLTFEVRSHLTVGDTRTLKECDLRIASKLRHAMARAEAGRNGDVVAISRGVYDKHPGARHGAALTESDPCIGGGGGDLKEDVATTGASSAVRNIQGVTDIAIAV